MIAVDGEKFLCSFRKLHAFISPHIASGNEFKTFSIRGWNASILICYDNNLPCNVEAVRHLGADLLFMPHVTCCLDWPIPGSGEVSREVWDRRKQDPITLRQQLYPIFFLYFFRMI